MIFCISWHTRKKSIFEGLTELTTKHRNPCPWFWALISRLSRGQHLDTARKGPLLKPGDPVLLDVSVLGGKCHCHRVCTHVTRRPLAERPRIFDGSWATASHSTFLYWLNAQRLRTLKLIRDRRICIKFQGPLLRWIQKRFFSGDGFDRMMNSQCRIF